METKPRPKDFITKNKFDVSNILKRLENTSAKPTTIQDLQTKIKNLNQEVKELRQRMFYTKLHDQTIWAIFDRLINP